MLDECHARGFMYKAVGMCNDVKDEVSRCLRAQRVERTAANREAARAKREQIKAVWAKIDEES